MNKLTEEEVVDELVESILYNKGEDLVQCGRKISVNQFIPHKENFINFDNSVVMH